MQDTDVRIATVNTEPTIMRLAELMLKPHYQVIPIHWTESILETIKDACPDIVMMDAHPDAIDANRKLAKSLRSDSATAKTPIVVLSANIPPPTGPIPDIQRVPGVTLLGPPLTIRRLRATINKLVAETEPDENDGDGQSFVHSRHYSRCWPRDPGADYYSLAA